MLPVDLVFYGAFLALIAYECTLLAIAVKGMPWVAARCDGYRSLRPLGQFFSQLLDTRKPTAVIFRSLIQIASSFLGTIGLVFALIGHRNGPIPQIVQWLGNIAVWNMTLGIYFLIALCICQMICLFRAPKAFRAVQLLSLAATIGAPLFIGMLGIGIAGALVEVVINVTVAVINFFL